MVLVLLDQRSRSQAAEPLHSEGRLSEPETSRQTFIHRKRGERQHRQRHKRRRQRTKGRTVGVYKECAFLSSLRAQALCESRGGRPGLHVPNSQYGLCGPKAALNEP